MKKLYLIIILLFLTNQLFALAPKTELISPISPNPNHEIVKKNNNFYTLTKSLMKIPVYYPFTSPDFFNQEKDFKNFRRNILLYANLEKRAAIKYKTKETLFDFEIQATIKYKVINREFLFQDYLNYLCPTTIEKNKLEKIKVLCIWGSQDLDNIIYTANMFVKTMKNCKIIVVSGGSNLVTPQFLKSLYNKYPNFVRDFECKINVGDDRTEINLAEIINWIFFQILIEHQKDPEDITFILDMKANSISENAKNTFTIFQECNLTLNPNQIALSQGPFIRRGLHTFEKYFKFQPLPICKQRRYKPFLQEAILLEYCNLIDFSKKNFMTDIDERGYALLGINKAA